MPILRVWLEHLAPAWRWPRVTALLVLTLISAAHLPTLTISPTSWQDEVQIVDHGRNLVEPDPEWAISWIAPQRPLVFLNFLGPIVQEKAYRWLAPSIAGPRLSSLLGALIAAYLVFLWLRGRAVSDGLALVIAATFLLDPVFVAGYRGARLDSWTIALAIAACLAVRRGGAATTPARTRGALVLAGGLMVVAFFVWPSAIYLVPLFIVEVVQVYGPRRAPLRVATTWALATLTGALAALALFVIVAGDQFAIMLADRFFSTRMYYHELSAWNLLLVALRDCAWSFQHSPILPTLALALALAGRNTPVAIAAGVALLAMLPTTIYVHRVVYFLPYIISIVGEGTAAGMAASPRRSWPIVVLSVALIWAAGLSLVVRPTRAILARNARQPSLLLDAASQMPELRSNRVYLGPWEFYYAGRQLDWKMVKPYVFDPDTHRAIFQSLDYALVTEEEARIEEAFFASIGWQRIHEMTLPPTYTGDIARPPSKPRHYYLYSRRPRATIDRPH